MTSESSHSNNSNSTDGDKANQDDTLKSETNRESSGSHDDPTIVKGIHEQNTIESNRSEVKSANGLPDSIESKILTGSSSIADRYRVENELGRGGLGRIIGAHDRILNRPVAVKEMLTGTENPSLTERFLREGKIAGRLAHPNVVPVYDVGIREEKGRKTPFFIMTRIQGRDLREILAAIEAGKNDFRQKYRRSKLLRIFQDACLAMAYAHNHGVIHRDLKPANIMVGEFGEVFVIDWGLAKVIDQKDEAAEEFDIALDKDIHPQPDAQIMTIEGAVMGTPAYMPPEQAEGKISDLDHRSDIYSLGAILYEILTFRPPFNGTTPREILANVLSTGIVPPSARADETRKIVAATFKDGSRKFPEDVPGSLEEIVVKAMSKNKNARYQSALELHDEIQLFLDGEKEKERNHLKAEELTAEGIRLAETVTKLRNDLKIHRENAKTRQKELKPYWPVEKKADFWALEKLIEDTRDKIVETFGNAVSIFQSAIEFEPGHAGARAGLADLYWEQYGIEEERVNRTQMKYFEGLVRKHNDGQYDANLKGDGTLAVKTVSFNCRCLIEGRNVQPDDMEIMGYHPFSGRALDGHKGAEGLPDLEPKEPIRLKVHGQMCKTDKLVGADAWLFRYEEKNKILVPVVPDGVEIPEGKRKPLPVNIAEKCYEKNSPYKPDKGLYCGKTPISKFSIPMGSYLLILHKDGFRPARVSINVERLEEQEINVTLFRPEEIPEDFIQIPAGKFIFGGDKEASGSGPKEIKHVQDFFMAKYPVTCGEYVEFLNDINERIPDDACLRVPRESDKGGYYWPKEKNGGYIIPTEEWLEKAPDGQKNLARRLSNSPLDWDKDWPVFSVSWEDLIAYSAWKTRKNGYLMTLPHEIHWEKSARGSDGRLYPFGNSFDPTFCNMNVSHEAGMRPYRIESFPIDESPFGVKGLGGNSRDNCINDPGEEFPRWRLIRGGGWTDTSFNVRTSHRAGSSTSGVFYRFGGRLVLLTRSANPEQ